MTSRNAATSAVYDTMGRVYAADVEDNVWNALYERPAMQDMLGDVSGKRILDAGCGSGAMSA